MKVTINKQDRLYVLHHSPQPCPTCHKPRHTPGYVTCYGFDNCQRTTEHLAAELGQDKPKARPGTMAYYRDYSRLCAIGRKRNAATGWRSTAELAPQLVGLEGRRVEARIVYGKTQETERFIVGKSTGWMPCHIALSRRDSTGGPAVVGQIAAVKAID